MWLLLLRIWDCKVFGNERNSCCNGLSKCGISIWRCRSNTLLEGRRSGGNPRTVPVFTDPFGLAPWKISESDHSVSRLEGLQLSDWVEKCLLHLAFVLSVNISLGSALFWAVATAHCAVLLRMHICWPCSCLWSSWRMAVELMSWSLTLRP